MKKISILSIVLAGLIATFLMYTPGFAGIYSRYDTLETNCFKGFAYVSPLKVWCDESETLIVEVEGERKPGTCQDLDKFQASILPNAQILGLQLAIDKTDITITYEKSLGDWLNCDTVGCKVKDDNSDGFVRLVYRYDAPTGFSCTGASGPWLALSAYNEESPLDSVVLDSKFDIFTVACSDYCQYSLPPTSVEKVRVIECWGDCRDEGTPNQICANYGSDWHAISVDCEEVEIPGDEQSWDRTFDSNLDWCGDGGGEDVIVTCANCDGYDGCYAYGTGCEMRDYYYSGGICKYSHSSRHTDYYDPFVYYCSGDSVRKHRLLHNYYCYSGCIDHTSWQDDQLVEDCNSYDSCSNGYYLDYYCSSGSCSYSQSCTEACCDQYYGDPNAFCSGGTCYPPPTTTTSTSTTTTIPQCTNHAQCSQACTALCPPNVYGCCYGCQLGQCRDELCQCVDATSYCSQSPPYQMGDPCTTTTTTSTSTTTTTHGGGGPLFYKW